MHLHQSNDGSMCQETEYVGEAQTDRSKTRKVIKESIQLVYTRSIIETPRYRNMLLSSVYKDKLVTLAMDEVKLWGDKFRMSFSHIGDLGISMLALTATATVETYHCVVQWCPLLKSQYPLREAITYPLFTQRPVWRK